MGRGVLPRATWAKCEHETHINFLSPVWGFVIAGNYVLTYHWTIGYAVGSTLQPAQPTIIVIALSFLAERVYMSFRRNGQGMLAMFLCPHCYRLVIGSSVVQIRRAATILTYATRPNFAYF